MDLPMHFVYVKKKNRLAREEQGIWSIPHVPGTPNGELIFRWEA
jgi:hypothetical protein